MESKMPDIFPLELLVVVNEFQEFLLVHFFPSFDLVAFRVHDLIIFP